VGVFATLGALGWVAMLFGGPTIDNREDCVELFVALMLDGRGLELEAAVFGAAVFVAAFGAGLGAG